MQNLWNLEEQRLLETLKKFILSGPTLARPNRSRRFYIKTYCSKYGMSVVIMQEYDSVEARNSESQEKDGGKFEFEKSLEGMQL